MLPDRVSNPGPLTYESDALPIALRGPRANSVDLNEVAHYEPPRQDLRCLQIHPFSSLVVKKSSAACQSFHLYFHC